MATVLEQGNITIHTENIFPIIKKSLYTDHEIFLRELISNSVDAIAKLKMVSYAGEVDGELPAPQIDITVDTEKKTLSVSDNGIGMTPDEIKKYINQVAFSSAEEFIQKYQKDPDQQIIGHFGLGFYSSFMVAKQVEIETLSHRPNSQAIHWSCDGSPAFELTEGTRTTPGTTVTLTLMDEETEYAEEARIKQLIKTYCDFMPVPIMMGEERLNQEKALWKVSPQDLNDEDYLEFYRYLHPFQDDPLLWVHLKTDYPFVLDGILYFPQIRPDVDVNKGQIKLFCNQVFVSDNCDDIIPDFLRPLRGVIDSTDIPLNVSRSALTSDRTVRRIADYISKKIADRLKQIFREDRAKFVKCWQDVGTFIKFGSLKDDKFKEQVADIIIYKSTQQEDAPQVEVQTEGEDEWQDTPTNDGYTTIKDYLERNKEKHENRVFYCTDAGSQAPYVELYKNQGMEVLYMDSFIDTNYFIPFLEREYSEVKFARVDAELDQSLLNKDESEIVDPTTNKTKSEVIKELFEKALENSKITIRAESIKSENPQGTPPAMVIMPEELRRIQEMTALMQQKDMEFPDMHTLLVNTAHPMVQNLLNLSQGSIVDGSGESQTGTLVNQMCQHIYDLALISQKPFDADNMKAFVERSNALLTKVSERL
ncbi:molecular chaperone HtpG [Spirulina major CS-329]|uniref:molecular chaperone HtpG n=1 Tax=Spirulina TaxID=1154 RepID=UPI00232B3F3E|nr:MULTISPECIES: molecular chaperone HtpG [Spirulina]MDB9493460.1 molecular chaperone HtpG [Spirulina subsalsa CS-330]MDB9505209.1 molecular chaperone HtpG [Spirulina major CS-329]